MIKFSKIRKPYGCFANFYPCLITVNGEEWPTTEHYYQAMKFPHNPEVRKIIQAAPTPWDAKVIARDQYGDLIDKENWEKIKTEVMLEALRYKFKQHEDLKKILLSTLDDIIVEFSPYDNFWGDGGDGTGENVLGKLLMKVRDELK